MVCYSMEKRQSDILATFRCTKYVTNYSYSTVVSNHITNVASSDLMLILVESEFLFESTMLNKRGH